MNVVTLEDPKEKEKKRRIEDQLFVINEMRTQIEAGDIREFVACSIDSNGTPQVHASCMDYVGSIGMFELGKHLMITFKEDDFEQ
jgi:hypothetical protein